jgi:hypothetical protein
MLAHALLSLRRDIQALQVLREAAGKANMKSIYSRTFKRALPWPKWRGRFSSKRELRSLRAPCCHNTLAFVKWHAFLSGKEFSENAPEITRVHCKFMATLLP